MRTLVWFRSDLRVADNAALHEAAREATDGVIGLYVISPEDWRAHDTAAVRVDFTLRTLRELSASLAALRIPLLVETAARKLDVPGVVLAAAQRHACAAVHCNLEYEVNESRRDRAAQALLEARGVRWRAHHDQVVLPSADIRTGAGGFYTVFTPFKKAFLRLLHETGGVRTFPAPRAQPPVDLQPSVVPARVEGFDSPVDPGLWPAGEAEALRRLRAFTAQRIAAYKDERDFPGLPGTSMLSPYLALGAISPRTCMRAAIEANAGNAGEGPGSRPGPTHWISELIWREFYRHVLVGFPRVCMGRAFKPATEAIRWSDRADHLAAWREGRTGVPIVDAAMRCLLQTGWMHNRLRMVVAMYLTKNLFIDWREGERWFMQRLVDGDLASNNGGWQWSASTGTDAAPYFRIFNPYSQSRKFDPQGAFLRRWLPELAGLDDDAVHDPSSLPALLRPRVDYPDPIVDLAASRERVMAEFRRVGDPRDAADPRDR